MNKLRRDFQTKALASKLLTIQILLDKSTDIQNEPYLNKYQIPRLNG